jgi:O-antigen ligase
MAVLLAGLVFLGFNADRAASLDRLLALETGADMRVRAFPTVWSMVAEFFPAGSGLGSFDAVFRGREPLALLKPTYFNHAHNDWLELALETGVPGLALLGVAVAWWAVASWRAWRGGAPLARLGSAAVAMIMTASIVDYPARTPMIMAILVVAGCWLATLSSQRPGKPAGLS